MRIIHQNPWLRQLAIASLLMSLLLTSGCQGCRQNLDEDEIAKKEAEEKKKPDFETQTPVLLPGFFPQKKNSAEEKEDVENQDPAAMANNRNSVIRFNRTKLGHWVAANFPMVANNFNADGQLSAYSMNAIGRPAGIPSTDYYLATSRPVALPKSEWKNLETTVFLPRRSTATSIANVNYSLDRSTGGLTQVSMAQPTALMKPFQYHIIVLSKQPESYNFLKLTDSVHLRGQQLSNGEAFPPFYYVVPSVPEQPIPLPRNALNWTTIAYVIWDDFDPESLTPEHQEALLDWLHFGGQLILSGPDCLDMLQDSFLAQYLPARFAGSRNLTNRDLQELNENWTVPVVKNAAERRTFEISDKVPLLGVSFLSHQEASFVAGTGEIAIERRIGRGRIVATSFSLNAPLVRRWRSFPGFLNNVLLRRPQRRFGRTEMSDIVFGWENDRTSIFDPLLGSTLRFLSRDLSVNGTPESAAYSLESDIANQLPSDFTVGNGGYPGMAGPNQEFQISRSGQKVPLRDRENYWHFGGYADAPQSGPGGWNDDSGVSVAARETLKEAAGITPPSSGFVLKMLAAYLVVLVPLNWLIFRVLGRVEWAWIAAPFIAIVGALLVVKMASLDIGFVRSNTQIGLLEIYADYPRGHTTEYSALYTSLSTRYDVDLDNPTAQSLPFARVDASQFFQDAESLSRVVLRRTLQNRLEGFQIQSNSTGMLHTEFMLDLEGTVSCGYDDAGHPEFINNGSILDIKNCGVVRRDAAGEYQIAWIGDFPAGSTFDEFTFESTSADRFAEQWRGIPILASSIRSADRLWAKYIGRESETADLDNLLQIPELADERTTYQTLLTRLKASRSSNQLVFSRDDFRRVFRSVNSKSGVRVGRLFDVIADQLKLAPGESRLLGTTEQRIGRTRFDPEATQTDQQTLVVIHLQKPKLPTAKRDINSLSDFTGRSDLDWQSEMDEFDLESGE